MVAFSSYYETISAVDLLTAEQELQAAREIEELALAGWTNVVADDGARRWVRKTLGSDQPQQLRADDPDRESLEHVLERLALRCDDREYLRDVSEANIAALRARNRMARANLRLVVKAARKFDFGLMPMADLVQEGNIGLLKAIGRFDHRRGVRFATYAVWWIRHSVRRAVAQKGRLVRLPVNVINGGYRLGKARRQLAGELGRAPSANDLAGAVDMSADKVEQLQAAMAQRELPIDAPDGDEDRGPSFLDETASDEPTPEDHVEAVEVNAALRQAMQALTEIEANIIRHRFGMDGVEEQTLTRLGEHYGVSRERIRQIQERALDKLRGVIAV